MAVKYVHVTIIIVVVPLALTITLIAGVTLRVTTGLGFICIGFLY